MNSINLYGRIVNDLELNETKGGNAYCRFNLAVKDGVDKKGEQLTQFIPCIAWNNLADVLVDYASKGDRLALEGKINISKYEDEDGETRSSFQVIVNKLHLVETKEESKNDSKKKSNKRKR